MFSQVSNFVWKSHCFYGFLVWAISLECWISTHNWSSFRSVVYSCSLWHAPGKSLSLIHRTYFALVWKYRRRFASPPIQWLNEMAVVPSLSWNDLLFGVPSAFISLYFLPCKWWPRKCKRSFSSWPLISLSTEKAQQCNSQEFHFIPFPLSYMFFFMCGAFSATYNLD